MTAFPYGAYYMKTQQRTTCPTCGLPRLLRPPCPECMDLTSGAKCGGHEVCPDCKLPIPEKDDDDGLRDQDFSGD